MEDWKGWRGDKPEPLSGCLLSEAGGAPASQSVGLQMEPGCALCEMAPTPEESRAKPSSPSHQITHSHVFGEGADRHSGRSSLPLQ